MRILISNELNTVKEDTDPFVYVKRTGKKLADNIDQVRAVLESKGIFHDQSRLIELLNKEISSFLAYKVMPPINTFIDNCNFDFFNIISNDGSLSPDFVRERIYYIFKNSFLFPEAEKFLVSTCRIFKYRIIDKYIPELLLKDEAIRSGLEQELEFSLSLKDWISFIKIIFLIRPMLSVKLHLQMKKETAVNRMKSFGESAGEDFQPVPEAIINEAVKSLLYAQGFSGGFLPGLIYIFDMMYRNNPESGESIKAEETYDKSWFALARINSGFYGFDLKILNELYSIAEGKNW